MVTPHVTEISAVSAHLSVPLGRWPMPHVPPVRTDSRPPKPLLTPPTDRR
jgi:hypothetical protein